MYMEACMAAGDRGTADVSIETRDGALEVESRYCPLWTRESSQRTARMYMFRRRDASRVKLTEPESSHQGDVLVYRNSEMKPKRQKKAERQQGAGRTQKSRKAEEPQDGETSEVPIPQKDMDDLPLVLFVGTSPNKNLIRAAKALQGLRCTLVVLGNLVEEQKALLSALTPGYQNLHDLSDEQVVSLYKRVHASGGILLFPSWYEGFGRPVIEAQSVGLPVVAGDIPVLHETSGEAALFVDPKQTESIRNAVTVLLRDAVLYESFSRKGKENAMRYRSKEAAEKYRDLYLLLAFTKRYDHALQRMKKDGQIHVRTLRRSAEKKEMRRQAGL